jgi:hypothetical protein
MYRWTRPPYAISGRVAYNPVIVDPMNPAFPQLVHRDPEPVSNFPGLVGGFNDWAQGEPAPIAQSVGMAWFRVRRHSVTRFVVTCGAGGTMGFKSYDEKVKNIEGKGVSDYFSNREEFNAVLASEIRLWYEIQWSAAVKPISPGTMPWSRTDGWGTPLRTSYNKNNTAAWRDIRSVIVSRPVNTSQQIEFSNYPTTFPRPPMSSAPCGSITYIQRLRCPPPGKSGAKHPDTNLTWDW